ncbi:hypothetical protein V1L52_11265 [Treponema sp. HNW]|uniref:hypothetical protein n=1 Tax=Treponema sp. HNW TaxID=3116654 RepID=UPI003D149340
MEKYVYRTRLKRKTGFLKYGISSLFLNAFFILLTAFAEGSPAKAENSAQEGIVHFSLSNPASPIQTKTDYIFTAEIPDVQPGQVEVFFEKTPEGAAFTGFEKTAAAGGTRLSYSVRFLEAGTIRLSPLQVRSKGKSRTAVFPVLTVFDNPGSLIPEFFFSTHPPSQIVQAGKPVRVRLSGRYFRRLHGITTEAPEDALWEEDARFFEPDGKAYFEIGPEKEADAVLIAEFVYTPFFAGSRELPQTEVSAESYGGSSYTVKVRPALLNALPSAPGSTQAGPVKESKSVPAQSSLMQSTSVPLPAAKAVPSAGAVPPAGAVPAAGDENLALRLAELRTGERHSPAFWLFRKERRALEKTVLLQNPDEAPLFWTLAAAAVFCILFIPIFVLLRRQRAKKIVFVLIMLACFCALFVLKNIPPLVRPALIAHNAVLRAIPEIGAQSSAVLQEGTRLRLLHESGDWYLASAGERRGWILKNEAIRIQNKEDK